MAKNAGTPVHAFSPKIRSAGTGEYTFFTRSDEKSRNYIAVILSPSIWWGTRNLIRARTHGGYEILVVLYTCFSFPYIQHIYFYLHHQFLPVEIFNTPFLTLIVPARLR